MKMGVIWSALHCCWHLTLLGIVRPPGCFGKAELLKAIQTTTLYYYHYHLPFIAGPFFCCWCRYYHSVYWRERAACGTHRVYFIRTSLPLQTDCEQPHHDAHLEDYQGGAQNNCWLWLLLSRYLWYFLLARHGLYVSTNLDASARQLWGISSPTE